MAMLRRVILAGQYVCMYCGDRWGKTDGYDSHVCCSKAECRAKRAKDLS